MKYIILILFTSFLLNPCFAQEGYNDYLNDFYELQAKDVPVGYVNGIVVISRSNDFYVLPAQVEDNQVALQPNQIQFVLNSMKPNKIALKGEEAFYPVQKQAAIIDSDYYNSPELLREVGVFAKTHISKNGIPEDWNEVRAKQYGIDNYNLVSHFAERVEGNPAVDSSVSVGPNGGGGAFDQVAFYPYQNPSQNIYWEVIGNTEFINNEWGQAIKLSDEWLEIIRERGALKAKQQHEAFLNDEISKGFNAIMGYGDNADLMINNSHGLLVGKDIWSGDRFSGTEIFYQPEEVGQRAIDVLNDFSNRIEAHPFIDYSVYVIGPNGGGGAYYTMQDELFEFTQHGKSKYTD